MWADDGATLTLAACVAIWYYICVPAGEIRGTSTLQIGRHEKCREFQIGDTWQGKRVTLASLCVPIRAISTASRET